MNAVCGVASSVKPMWPGLNGAAQVTVGSTGWDRLKDYVIERTGLAYYRDRDDALQAILKRRCDVLGLTGPEKYLRLLQSSEEGSPEFRSLVSELTVDETYFFRHKEQFDALRNRIFPEILRQRQRRWLRIWSAGCSIGAEPYSLAILLEQSFGAQLAGWDVSIVATDLDERSLAAAREGCYGNWSLRACSDYFRARHFSRAGDRWRLHDRHRRWVSFKKLNLAHGVLPPTEHLADFDLILCRNVMMYFDGETIGRLVNQMRSRLADGGWLLVGPSETDISLYRDFETVNAPGAVLYRRPAKEACEQPCWRVRKRMPEAPVAAATPAAAPVPERKFPLRETPPENDLKELQRLSDEGELKAALTRCQSLLTKYPLSARLHWLHGLLLASDGAEENAEKFLRQAIYLDRKYAPAHHHLGLLLRRRGDTRSAQRAFRNAVDALAGLDDHKELPGLGGLTARELKTLALAEMAK